MPERAAAPKHVEIVDEIPLTSVGKPYKPELRRRAAERAARDALAETGLGDQVRAVLVDAALEIHVPHSPHDDEVAEALSQYAWTWRTDRIKETPMSTDTITEIPVTQSVAQGRWRIDPDTLERRIPHAHPLGAGDRQRPFRALRRHARPAAQPGDRVDDRCRQHQHEPRLARQALRSADFFDVVNHPQVRFVSDTRHAGRRKVEGSRPAPCGGQSMPLEFDARLRRVGDELEVDATTTAPITASSA